MSDRIPREPGQDDAALPPELAHVERLLLAEGQRWRRMDPPTAGLEAHLRALIQRDGQRSEERMLTDRESTYQEAPTPRAPSRPSSRWRGPLALVATLLLIAMAASIFTVLRMAPGTGANRQSGDATPTPALVRVTAPQPKDTHLPIANDQFLSDISFSSANDGWAVGGTVLASPYGMQVTGQAPLVHFHDGVWAPVLNTAPVNAFPSLALDSVSMVSATDGWAIGSLVKNSPSDKPTGPVFLRYTGSGSSGHWNNVDEPAGLTNAYLRSIHMFSPDSGYATGLMDVYGADGVSITQYALVVVYQNGVWTPIQTQFPGDTTQVVMVSPSEGWAAQVKDLTPPGGVQDQQTTIYHYLNGAWTAGETFTGAVASLSAQSPDDVWLLATQCYLCTEPSPRIEQYNGSAWSRIQPPDESSFPQPAFGATNLNAQSLYDGGTSGVWLTYNTSGAENQKAQYLTSWRYTGTGWALVNASPASGQLVAITADHDGGVWAITQSENASGYVSTSVLYSQGAGWAVYGKN